MTEAIYSSSDLEIYRNSANEYLEWLRDDYDLALNELLITKGIGLGAEVTLATSTTITISIDNDKLDILTNGIYLKTKKDVLDRIGTIVNSVYEFKVAFIQGYCYPKDITMLRQDLYDNLTVIKNALLTDGSLAISNDMLYHKLYLGVIKVIPASFNEVITYFVDGIMMNETMKSIVSDKTKFTIGVVRVKDMRH